LHPRLLGLRPRLCCRGGDERAAQAAAVGSAWAQPLTSLIRDFVQLDGRGAPGIGATAGDMATKLGPVDLAAELRLLVHPSNSLVSIACVLALNSPDPLLPNEVLRKVFGFAADHQFSQAVEMLDRTVWRYEWKQAEFLGHGWFGQLPNLPFAWEFRFRLSSDMLTCFCRHSGHVAWGNWTPIALTVFRRFVGSTGDAFPLPNAGATCAFSFANAMGATALRVEVAWRALGIADARWSLAGRARRVSMRLRRPFSPSSACLERRVLPSPPALARNWVGSTSSSGVGS